MTDSSIEATRDLCDDLVGLIELAKQGRARVRAISLVERACAELNAYLDQIDDVPALSPTTSGLEPVRE